MSFFVISCDGKYFKGWTKDGDQEKWTKQPTKAVRYARRDIIEVLDLCNCLDLDKAVTIFPVKE